MSLVGRLIRRDKWFPDKWWRERLLLRARLGEGDVDGGKLEIDRKEIDALRESIDTMATIETLPTQAGLEDQYVPFEDFLIVSSGTALKDVVPEGVREFFQQIDPLVDRKLAPKILTQRRDEPYVDAPPGYYVFFGAGVFVPEERAIPRGRAYVKMSNRFQEAEDGIFPIVFSDKSGQPKAGWYLWQNRMCFSSWAISPAIPYWPPDTEETPRSQLSDEFLYFVAQPTLGEKPVLLRRKRREISDAKVVKGRAETLVESNHAADRESEFLATEEESVGDLVYEAPIGSERLSEGLGSMLTFCIEPNSSVSRLRKSAHECGPIYLEVLSVLVPRALNQNKILSVVVNFDRDDLLLAHALRPHALSLVLRQRAGLANELLSFVGMQDSDEILLCLPDRSQVVPIFGRRTRNDNSTATIADTSACPENWQIANELPAQHATRYNKGLPKDSCNLAMREDEAPLGYLEFPLHNANPHVPNWAENLPLRLQRREAPEALPERDCLLDWLDESIQIETEVEGATSRREGYAQWLEHGAESAGYGFLAPNVIFSTDSSGSFMSERFEGHSHTTRLMENDVFRVGPLLVRMRFQ
jgi:hypothetical protein